MHITPMDIYQREFSRKNIGGLDDNEVYGYLKKVGREYEALYAENKSLQENNQRLTGQMQDYLELERTLKQTLISAQKTSGDMKDNAEKQAELIVKQAELQAERILKVELRTVLESYLAMVNEESPSLGHNVEPLEKVA